MGRQHCRCLDVLWRRIERTSPSRIWNVLPVRLERPTLRISRSVVAMADLIDPTQTGNYPVVLSDRLLDKATDDIFTGVRYNHKPSSIPSDARARLKPSIPGQTSSYDLNVLSSSSSSTTHAFAGTRTTQNGKYVLYFDAENQRFVLDRVDSTFNMNLTRTPENSDPGALERRFPHIDESGKKKEKKERAKSP